MGERDMRMMKIIGKELIKFSKVISIIGKEYYNNSTDEQLIEALSKYHNFNKVYSDKMSDISNNHVDFDLSIIVPFYNAPEEYIHTCLESLIKQKTRFKYEIICINDGSKNNTLEELEKYKKKYENIRVINQSNQGISITRNKGVELARGRYIGFVDQDDWVDEKYVELLIDNAYKEDADIVKCSYSTLKGEKKISQQRVLNKRIKGYMGDEIFKFTGMIWSGVYKRELFYNVRFPRKYWFEDMVTRFLLYRKSNMFVSVENELYFKRKHNSNASVIVWKNNNNKSLEHIYLAYQLNEYGFKLGLQQDTVLLKLLLDEFGSLMWWRIKELKEEPKKEAFLLAANCLKDINIENPRLSYSENVLYNIFLKKNYTAWKIFCLGAWLSER